MTFPLVLDQPLAYSRATLHAVYTYQQRPTSVPQSCIVGSQDEGLQSRLEEAGLNSMLKAISDMVSKLFKVGSEAESTSARRKKAPSISAQKAAKAKRAEKAKWAAEKRRAAEKKTAHREAAKARKIADKKAAKAKKAKARKKATAKKASPRSDKKRRH
jgi:hypothetical protein